MIHDLELTILEILFNDASLARHDLAPSAPAQAARFALWQNGHAIAPDGPATQRNLCAGPVRSAREGE